MNHKEILEFVGVSEAEYGAFTGSERLYCLQSQRWYGWLCGKKEDRQALVSFIYMPERLEILWFDEAGKMTTIEEVELPPELQATVLDQYGGLDIGEEDCAQVLGHLGLVENTIEVRAFHHPDGSSLEPFTYDHEEFLQDPFDECFDDSHRERYPAMIRSWMKSGNYVFFWPNSYFVNGSGEVVSS